MSTGRPLGKRGMGAQGLANLNTEGSWMRMRNPNPKSRVRACVRASARMGLWPGSHMCKGGNTSGSGVSPALTALEGVPPQAMSTKEQKDMKRSAKRPRVDPNLRSDDSQNPDAITPANNPAVDTSEMGSCSSGSDVQEASEPVQKRIQDFKGGITRSLLAKRKQFSKDINASFRSLNENLQSIFKTQQKSRQDLHSIHSQMFESLYQKWLDEVVRAGEQVEHLNLIAQQQMEILQKAIEDHETKMENAKDICDTFLKRAKDLSEQRKAFIGGDRSEVKREIFKAQDRVIMETQEQDVSVVETYLQSLVLDCPEEAI